MKDYMRKREADFGKVFRHYLRTRSLLFDAAAFELKQTTTSRLPFDAVAEHQIDALEAASGPTGLLYKAPDDSRGVKPFDYFWLRRQEAFVVIKYPGIFHIIKIRDFLEEKKRSKWKSLTETRAGQIAVWSVKI